MSAEDRRLVALTAWAAWAEADGWDVPAAATLAAIARSGSPQAEQGPHVAAWRATIEQLLHQVRFGVNDPHLQLPDDLRRPAPDAVRLPAPQQDDGLLQHLRADPSVPASGLKDVHLKLIVKSGLRTADQIRSFLPVGPDRQAEAIASSIASYSGDVDVDVPAASVPAASAPDDPRPPRPSLDSRRSAPAASPSDSAASAGAEAGPAPADGAVEPVGFAPYEFGTVDGEPLELSVARDQAGTVRVSWPAHATRAVYRVVAEDADAPYSPDDSRLVAATTGTAAVDPEPLDHAVRHYQVWRNDGTSLADARSAQPVLHARGMLIAPVEQAALRWEAGQVVGQWRTRPGTSAVHVFRVPRRAAAQASTDSRFRLEPQKQHLNGILDVGAEPGERYLYRIVAEADVDGANSLSAPVVVPLDIPAQLVPITDLTVTRTATGAIDLLWTAPLGGRVVMYRTREEPAAGIGRTAVSEALLAEQGGMAVDDRLAHPIESGPDRVETMAGVAWPTGWTRAFFTPVVIQNGQALVGPSARFAKVPPVGRPVLVERVRRQLLMFDWPEGAESVEAYRSETGAPSADALHGTPLEISRDDYRERGGFELRGLPPRGCDLHLVSVLFDVSRRVQSEPVRVHYDGILRLAYTCTVKRPLFGQKGVFLSISAEFPPGNPPPFVLVHHPDRLPLGKHDGTSLPMVLDGPDAGPPSVQFRPRSLGRPDDAEQVWRLEESAWRRVLTAGGWVRLFVDVAPELTRRLALLDPPVPTLRVSAKGGDGV